MKRLTNRTYFTIAALCIAGISAAVNAQQRAPWGDQRYNDRDSRYNDRDSRSNDRGNTYNSQRNAPWPSDRFDPQQQGRNSQANTAGQFDYYALVLSWSPSYCSGAGDNDDQQCNRSDGKRFSFVLHGLWPQYEKGYPQDCRTARRPFVPQPLIDSMLDIMPSSRLVIHEYRKHGTCSGLQPDGYLSLARQLYSSIRIPERFKNPFEQQFTSPSEVIANFTRANPQITPDMMAVACGGAGNRLKEIRFCFSKDGKPRSCGENENQRRMCSSDRMFVPPVRSTARDDQLGSTPKSPPGSGQYRDQNPLPGPRMIERPRGI
ncbi:MAG: ribonuclease T2 [Hyphomicrobium sp.]|nr:ribonuclease T2 [Hyphomicrobium sp.]